MAGVIREFTALQDFESEETRSAYAKGFTYKVLEDNSKLNMLVDLWIRQGKVSTQTIGPRLTGSGEVS